MENIQWLSDKAILERLGQKLKDWRLEMNLSQKELARKAQISLITIQQIEYGKGASMGIMLRVLRVLGHLDLLEMIMQEPSVSPIEYQKIAEGWKKRQRASKKKENDKDLDSKALW